MANTDVAAFSPAAQTLYRKKAFDFLRKDLRFHQSGLMESIPKNGGQVISTYRLDNLSAATSALTEGTAPSEVQVAGTTFSATLAQYGNFAKVTDLLEISGRSDTMEQFSRQFGYNGALSVDTLTYNEYLNATAHFANNYNSGNMGPDAYVTSKEIRRLGKKFRANNVRPNDDGYYNLFLHPDCEFDVVTDDNFGSVIDLQKRVGDQNEVLWKGVAGTYGGFKVYTTSLITTTATGTNGQTAYRNIATGYGALLNVGLGGMPFQLFVNPSSNVNISNPLAQLGSVGWKATYVAKLIGTDGPRAYRVLATASEPS